MQEMKTLSADELRQVQGGWVVTDLWNKMIKEAFWPASCAWDSETEEDCMFFGPEAA